MEVIKKLQNGLDDIKEHKVIPLYEAFAKIDII
mgnify:CR=1 FL=1